jgi:hypothetical protein
LLGIADGGAAIREGDKVKIVYKDSGMLYFFEGNIINYITGPANLLLLSYPDPSDPVRLEEKRRVDCAIAASLKNVTRNTERPGVVSEMGPGGCRFSAAPLSDAPPPDHGVGDQVELTLKPSGSERVFVFPGRLEDVAREDGGISLLVEFLEPEKL